MRNAIITRIGRSFEIVGSPPVGNVGDAYSYTFSTTGGFGTIIWTCTSLGTSGATFSNGTLSSASLLNAGNFAFTLTAVDQNRQVATKDFILTVLGSDAYAMATEGSPVFEMATETGIGMRPE
jgi:hypothetical protein